jgi:exonuclease SbcC
VSGRNGVGKTSLLEAIRVAFTNNGQRSLLVNADVTEGGAGLILFTLSDGTEGEREVREKSRSRAAGPVSLYRNGEKLGAAQAFLDSLAPQGFGFNPLDFIEMRADQQTKALLEVLNLPISIPQLMGLTGGRRSEIDYTEHPLTVLEAIAKLLETERTEERRAAREAEATAERLGDEIPADFDAQAAAAFDLSSAVASLNEISSVKAALAKNTTDLARIDEQLRMLTQRKSDLEQMNHELLDNLALLPDEAGLTAGIQSYKERQRILGLIEQQRAQVEAGSAYRAQAEMLHDQLMAVRAKPAELLSQTNLPIEGLGIADNVITVRGIPLSQLSTGEQLSVAAEIAIATLGDLRVILIDGFERLDSKHQEQMLARFAEAGVQAFITEVTDDELQVLVDGKNVTSTEDAPLSHSGIEDTDEEDWSELLDEADAEEGDGIPF